MLDFTMYESDKANMNNLDLVIQLETFVNHLNIAKEELLKIHKLDNLVGTNYDQFHIKRVGKKFIYINSGGSGCFLVDRQGEIYNIKAYGVADYNKKKKADLGNIATVQVNALWLHEKRWNYLR